MKIIRNGMEFALTSAELEQAFREQQRNYRRNDAESHLREWADENFYEGEFEDCVGFSLEEACAETSEHFLLDHLVDAFDKKKDCNNDENSTWENCVQEVVIAYATNVQFVYPASVKLVTYSPDMGEKRLVSNFVLLDDFYSLDALNEYFVHDALAHFEALLAKVEIVNGKVEIKVNVRKRKQVGEPHHDLFSEEYIQVPHLQKLEAEMVNGKFRFISAIGAQKGGAEV